MENITQCPQSVTDLLEDIEAILREEGFLSDYRIPTLEDMEDENFFTVEEITDAFSTPASKDAIMACFRGRSAVFKPILSIYKYLDKICTISSGSAAPPPEAATEVIAENTPSSRHIDITMKQAEPEEEDDEEPVTPGSCGGGSAWSCNNTPENPVLYDYTPASMKEPEEDPPIQVHQPVVTCDPYSYSYDSKQATGHVGLRNQGATCYLNSLIQTLYHIAYFRNAIYNISLDSDTDEETSKCIPFALQKLFLSLETSPDAPSTRFLTKSFGWSGADTATQHDIQEFMRVLCDSLSERLKKIDPNPHMNFIMKLFKGELVSYVRCTDISYESRREEEIYDINLVVRQTGSIQQAMDLYVKEDTLDGDNMYEAEFKDGRKEKHPAKKGCIFKKLPPVLMMHLKRFDFDFETLRQCKVNEKFEFDEEIDLTSYVEPKLPRAGSSQGDEPLPRDGTNDSFTSRNGTFYLEPEERQIYVLHSVMVHSGTIHGGHYICYVKPDPQKGWVKFDDTVVSHATFEEAVSNNYGGTRTNEYGYEMESNSNAYLLTYIRKQFIEVMTNPPCADHTNLKERIRREEEKEEQVAQEKLDAPNNYNVSILTEEDVIAHSKTSIKGIGGGNFIPKNRSFKIRKVRTTSDLIEEVGTVLGSPAPRLWRVTPDQYRFDYEEIFSDDDILTATFGYISPHVQVPKDVMVFASYCKREDNKPEGIVFVKLFDSDKNEFVMKTHFTCVVNGTTYGEVSERISQATGGKYIAMHHEVDDSKLDPVTNYSKLVFSRDLMQHHLVLLVQTCDTEEERDMLLREADCPAGCRRATDVYFETLHKTELRILPYPMEDDEVNESAAFPLSVLTIDKVATVVDKITMVLTPTIAPEYLRIHTHSAIEGRPRFPIRFRDYQYPVAYNLTQNVANTLYYEKLTMPLEELEKKTEMFIRAVDKGTVLGKYSVVLDNDDYYTDIKEVVDKLVARHKADSNGVEDTILTADPSDLCLVCDTPRCTIQHILSYHEKSALAVGYGYRWRVEKKPAKIPDMDDSHQDLVHVYRLVVGNSFNKIDYEFHGMGFVISYAHTDTTEDLRQRVRGYMGLLSNTDEELNGTNWPIYVTNEHEYVKLAPEENVQLAIKNLSSEWYTSTVVVAVEMPVSQRETDAKRRKLQQQTRTWHRPEQSVKFKS